MILVRVKKSKSKKQIYRPPYSFLLKELKALRMVKLNVGNMVTVKVISYISNGIENVSCNGSIQHRETTNYSKS